MGSCQGSCPSIISNTATCRLSKPVVGGDVYHCKWDMKLPNESIAGKSPSHGFMCLKLVSRKNNGDISGHEEIVWERRSAVLEYPFSSVIAFRLSLHEKQVSHNLFVNSVGNTTKDKFAFDGTLEPSSLYFEIEFGSGEIEVTHGKRLIIAQELGSTLLVNDYEFEDEQATIDEAITEIMSKIGFKPQRLQYGDSPTTFVLEFNEKLKDIDLNKIQQNLDCTVQRIQETNIVQVLINAKDKVVSYDLEENFSRTRAGGGSVSRVEMKKDIPGCWVISFKKKEIARNIWMMKKYSLTIGEHRVNACVLPVYSELGFAVNSGEKPVIDLSPLIVDVDQHKLRFVKLRDTERKSFEAAMNKTIKVKVFWESKPIDECDDDFEEDSEDEIEQISIKLEYCDSKSDWKKSSIWKNKAKKEVLNYFKKYIYQVEFSIEDDRRDNILDKLKTLNNRYSFDYVKDFEKQKITLYGSNKAALIEVAVNAGKKIVIPETVTKSVDIPVQQYLALEAEGILQTVKTNCPFTSFKVNTETEVITLKGPNDEVKNAHRNILNFALNVKTIELQISEEIAKILRKGGIEILTDQFRKEKINHNVAISETGHSVIVITYVENETIEKKRKKMLEIISNCINTFTISVVKEPPTTFTTIEWNNCKRDIDVKTNGLVDILGPTNKQIKIIGTEETVKVAKADIESYLKSHKLGTKMMHVPVEIAEYLDEFKSDEVRDKIECIKDSLGWYTGQVSLKCSTSDLNRVQNVVEKEIKEIKQHWFVMNEKWIASIIQDLVDLKTLSHNERFILQTEIGHTLAAQGILGIAVFSNSGSIIQVKVGDMTIETTAAIVHSTNGNIKAFEKGMGRCLQDIGGSEIKNELLRIIKERKPKLEDLLQRGNTTKELEQENPAGSDNKAEQEHEGRSNSGFKPGEIILTGSGRLRCLKVIHVYPPKWIDGQKSEEKDMKALVKKILETCQYNKLASVSLSAIGCGAGGYPIDKATLHIVEAVADFIEKTKDLVIKEIVLCDTSENAANKFTEALAKFKSSSWFFFNHGQNINVEDFLSSSKRKAESKIVIRPMSSRNPPTPPKRPQTALKWGRRNAHGYTRAEDKDSGTNDDPEMIKLFNEGLPFHIPITKGLTLHVVKSDLTMQEVDAIVNPTSEFPNISGEVSKAIVTAGGTTIRQECQNIGPISEGETQVTGAGRLKCHNIIHVRLPVKWNSKTGEKFVGDLVSNCLAEAVKQGHSSIAFPTIGTGNSGFPADKIANAMVKSVCEAGNERTSLTDVYIVVYSLADGICKIFEDVIPHCFNSDTSSMAGLKISKKGPEMSPKRKIVKYVSPPSFDKHSEIDDVVVFKIVSKTSGKELQKRIEEAVKEHIIKTELDFHNLSKERTLTEVEESSLKTLEMKYGVTVVINKSSTRVEITGLSERVKECQFEAIELLKDTFPTRRMKERNVRIIGETVQWYYDDAEGNSQPVHVIDNYEIHMQYLHGNDFTYLNNLVNKTYKVIVNDMMEHPTDDPKKRRRLYLRTKIDGTIPLPDNWKIALDENENMAQIKLKESDAEFNEVKDKFIRGGCRPKKIEGITRLENKYLWQQYQTKKRQIESQNPSIQNERDLWHGTDQDTVSKIIKHGYDRSFTTVAAHGVGAYFALNSSYSDNSRYAKPDATGVKRMFLNKVLVGYSCLGNSSMAVLPVRQMINNMPVLYDSAADSNGKQPTIYVIFHDTQAYPEYLIEYS